MARQVPKNVRQIGNVSDNSKIYIEDFVETFLNQLCEKTEKEMQGAFLIGEKVQEDDNNYIFVCGAIQMEGLQVKGKDIIIEENTWKKACETSKEFFGNNEILGWFIAGNEKPVEITHNISKIHQKYFSREHSIFITRGYREKEENLYIYKFQEMLECQGHYIFYEMYTFDFPLMVVVSFLTVIVFFIFSLLYGFVVVTVYLPGLRVALATATPFEFVLVVYFVLPM